MRLAATFKRLYPGSLGARLFIAILCFILLPYTALQSYAFDKLESFLEGNAKAFYSNQLLQVADSFQNLETNITLLILTLQNDKRVQDILKQQDGATMTDRSVFMEDRLHQLRNHLLLGERTRIAVIDRFGNLYGTHSFSPAQPYDRIRSDPRLSRDEHSPASRWFLEPQGGSGQGNDYPVLGNYAHFIDEGGASYAAVLVTVDLQDWLYGQHASGQQYLIVDRSGATIAESRTSGATLTDTSRNAILASPSDYHHIDDRLLQLVQARYIVALDCYVVSLYPLNVFIGGLKTIRQSIDIVFYSATLAFIVFTFFIAASVSRPLRVLRKKMNAMVRHNMRIKLPEEGVRGEIYDLHKAFNQMTSEIAELIQKWRQEERQKEAARFRMLMHQLNPHFLLNTLNSIKWMALDQGNTSIYETSLALGKILEMSLSSEIEMIYLKDELGLVRAYEQIQRKRYKDLFVIRYDIGERLDYALVPKFCIQPLIENAILHGFSELETGGIILVRVRTERNMLIVDVEDNGQGGSVTGPAPGRGKSRGTGIGLTNIRSRLELLFKENGRLEAFPVEPRGSRFRMSMPLLLSEPYDKGGER
ncbi:sensor histidine kinase [Paenibacillus flagellatus]|uniref:HAMP domain-containing protein n=1 Tax=Paenibacillus flagellatus TaxID=2211139 RepID=A0A2V5KKZ3_9BACL|nr:histidine kinase [Paenibacillus flagellatus]PYI55540.1 hypothetical protein DLM86_07350 [Paenibacillus flagellatus]